jgi:hypothetical protein
MRDLTLAHVHTYYVLAGTTPVLVHNNNPGCGGGTPQAEGASGADAGGLTQTQLDDAYSFANDENKLKHVIDPGKHGFSNLVKSTGGRSEAMWEIVNSLAAANDLPASGRFQVTRIIGGENVTIQGAMVNGVPRIGTAYIPATYPHSL